MKYAIDYGHNAPSFDIGAKDIKFEDDLVLEVGEKLVEKLRKSGHEVVLTQPKSSASVGNSLRHRCRVANENKCDVFVSLHFNSFINPSARGTEVWVASANSAVRDEAALICQNIAKIGFVNRGVKVGNFQVLRDTSMPAMLVECCFVSSPVDCELYDAEQIAEAIFKGLNKNKVDPIIDVSPHKENVVLKVIGKTFLKPSTKQSIDIDDSLLKIIDVGEYEIDLLANEEGHYLITFDDKSRFGKDKFFIYSGHCELIDV